MAQHSKAPIQILETERLRLRPLRLSDAPRIQVLFNNANVLKYMAAAIPWPYPEDGALEFVRQILPKMEALDEYYWAITEKESADDLLIGTVGLMPNATDNHRGFWLGEPYWGRGYMKEAVAAVQDFAFGPLGMTEMLLNNAQANIASHRLKELSGAEILEVVEHDFLSGRLPEVQWRLTAESWAQHRGAFLTGSPKKHIVSEDKA